MEKPIVRLEFKIPAVKSLTSDGGIATTFNSCAMNQHFLMAPTGQYSLMVPVISNSLKVGSSTLDDSRELIVLGHLDLLDIDQHKVGSLRNRVTQAQFVKVLGKRVPSLGVRLNLIREKVVLVGLFETDSNCLLERRIGAEDDSG
jgi:hypothetical protein